MEIKKHVIMVRWGKGFMNILHSMDSRQEAFAYVNHAAKMHNRKHKKGNVPTFFLLTNEAFIQSEAKSNFTEEQKIERKKNKIEFMNTLSKEK